jgi:hypothetical protein
VSNCELNNLLTQLHELANDAGVEQPVCAANMTQKDRITQLALALQTVLGVVPILDGPHDAASYYADLKLPRSLATESAKANPALAGFDYVAAIRISSFGNLVTINGEENLELSVRRKLVPAIEGVGFTHVPREVAEMESCFAGESWADLFFQYI